MELKQLGEFGLIDRIREQFSTISAGNCEGIGDDCAVIPVSETEALVVTTDMLSGGIHFLPETIPPYALGRKSLAVNLSDIAAMGAAPCATFLSVALPASTAAEWVDAFLKGYRSLSEEFAVALLGGDTTSSPDVPVISVTAIGRVARDRIKRRSAAEAGDKIFVTGQLGDSAKGLLDILAGDTDSEFARIHHDPKPYVREGAWLGQQPAVHAMMDVSDGLASDLLHICRASRVSAEIDLERIPARVDTGLAVTGGEDYVLLLTADPESAPSLARAYRLRFGETLREIGTIREGGPEIRWKSENQYVNPDWKGFTHF